MKTEPKLGSAELIELVERHSAHNYHPLPVVVAEAEGAWVTDVEGKRYLGHARRLLGAELRSPPSRSDPRRQGATRPGHTHLSRVPSRSVRSVLRATRRALRNGHGPRDELRRRGRGDRAQDGTTLGLRREGCSRGSREDRRMRRQLPRTHDHDRRVLVRPLGDRWVRPVHPGVRLDPLRRRRRARHRPRGPRCRRVPGRAHPGRGGRRDPSRGLSARSAAALHGAERADDRRRDPDRPRPHRHDVRLRSRGREARRVPPRQGARRRDPPGLGGGLARRRARGVPPGRAREHVRREPDRMRRGARGAPPAAHR